MKLYLIFLSGLVLANAVAAAAKLRTHLDEFQDKEDYKYNIVHSLHYRRKRDVSHLDLAYLPPAMPNFKQHSPSYEKEHKTSEKFSTIPSGEYLPPATEINDSQNVIDTTIQHDITMANIQEGVETINSPLSNQYLPPKADMEVTNKYLPPITTGEDLPEIPLEPTGNTNEDSEIKTETIEEQPQEESLTDVAQPPKGTCEDTEILDVDGYHYKIPDIKPNLFPPVRPTTKYLPSLEDGVVEAEGPANGGSAVLENDGYHYRSIKLRL